VKFGQPQSQLRIHLLGGFQVEVGEESVLHFPTDKIRALLAYFAIAADRPHRRETLATLFWGNWPDAVALRNFRQALYRLRAMLDGAIPGLSDQLFTITRQDVTFHSRHVWIDVARVKAQIATLDPQTSTTLTDRPAQLQPIMEAVGYYRGELLQGLAIEDAPEFESWLFSERETLGQAVLKTLSTLADAYQRCGATDKALACARQQLTLDPWHEPAHRQAMCALEAMGQRSEALAHYQRCRATLLEEMGVEPEEETTALYTAILAHATDPFCGAHRRVGADSRPVDADTLADLNRGWR
jgi:DNA-binding SARP family transcriptional activator